MKKIVIQPAQQLSIKRKEEIFRLWNSEYPQKLSYTGLNELTQYLNALKDHNYFLLLDEKKDINGLYFDFLREGEKWFAILINRSVQNLGFGTLLLDHAKELRQELSAWVIDHNEDLKNDGTPYISPLPFYLKKGFTILPEVRFETEQLSAVKIKWKK